ncbi:MAG: serine hydrolase domain-containing protein [Candidatus Kapaibacterium sp.]
MHKLTRLLIPLAIFFVSACSDNSTDPPETRINKRIVQIVDSVVANSHVPGCIAGIWAPDEDISLVYAAGYSNPDDLSPMLADYLFRIGSNTKTMTITVLLQLVDEGKIRLDDKLSEYMPGLPHSDSVTIEMLCNMTSGYFNYSESEYMEQIAASNPTKVWQPDELIAIAMDNPIYFPPGTGFHYSNTNTIIIGKLIEQLTGLPLKENIETRIFLPLGLGHTYFMTSGIDYPDQHFCHGYYNGEYVDGHPDFSEVFDISWAWAAGSGISEVRDLKTYVEALVGGDFISDELQQKRLECNIEVDESRHYGIGMMNVSGFYGHSGGLMGYSSFMVRDPERNCTAVIMLNCQLHEISATDVFKLIAKEIYPEIVFW